MSMPPKLRLAALEQAHPCYDKTMLRVYEALYKGGRAVTAWPNEELFPRHRKENPTVYDERKRRSFYIPYAGEIIDHLTSSVFHKPVRLELKGDVSVPDEYREFEENAGRPGAPKVSLSQLMREQLTTALVKRTAYTLVDLPRSQATFATLADQLRAGALRAYAVPVEPEAVIDWEEDDAGSLEWVVIYSESRRRASPSDFRDATLKAWTFYTRDAWFRYELAVKDNVVLPPDIEVPLVDSGTHTFGEVPVVRLTVPDGLWAMSKLEGLARELYNKASALSWAQFLHLFPEKHHYKGTGGDVCAPVYEDGVQINTNPLTQQTGQGYLNMRLAGDDDKFVGPDTSGYDHAANWLKSVRDEMHRVVHSMANSQDQGAALRRSADSRELDKEEKAIVLKAFSQLVLDHVAQVMRLICIGRKDVSIADQWAPCGADSFSTAEAAPLVERMLSLSTMSVAQQSPTAWRMLLMLYFRSELGAEATDEMMAKIEEELEQRIEAEANESPDELARETVPELPAHDVLIQNA